MVVTILYTLGLRPFGHEVYYMPYVHVYGTPQLYLFDCDYHSGDKWYSVNFNHLISLPEFRRAMRGEN